MRVGPHLSALVLIVAALTIAAAPARAQEDASVSLGVGFSVTRPFNSAAADDIGPGIVIRLRGSQGLGPTLGLSWFTSAVHTEVSGQRVKLGDVSVKPLLFGIGYGRDLSRRLNWGASIAAGVAFTKARGTGALKEAFARQGIEGVGVRVSDAFTWRVNTGIWIDLGSSFGLNLSVGYLDVRPSITITSSAGDTRRAMDLDSIVTSVGFTYGIF